MIHIIWSGKGFLVAVFVFGFSLIANLITNFMTGSGAYWDAHKWPFAVSLFVSAVACGSVGSYYRNLKAQVLIDPKTCEEVILRQSHTLFFIPVVWWSPILATFGLITLGIEFLR
jgi:hypothetical protein